MPRAPPGRRNPGPFQIDPLSRWYCPARRGGPEPGAALADAQAHFAQRGLPRLLPDRVLPAVERAMATALRAALPHLSRTRGCFQVRSLVGRGSVQ